MLQPEEYDGSYFDRLEGGTANSVLAGYAKYKRWPRHDGTESLGEFWLDKAKGLIDQYNFTGKLLEVGCAKGFVVQGLRDLGVDAYGIDVSQYAIDNCEPGMDQYLTVGDARTLLANKQQYKKNSYDVVISLRFLECIPEADLPDLISNINRICKTQQVHFIDEQPNSNFYIAQPLSWWATQGFESGTVLVAQETNQQLTV